MVLVTKNKKTPTHHRKRQANHHRRGKDYDKHYWPYLPLLGIIGLGFMFNIFWAPLSHNLLNDGGNSAYGVLGYATATSPDGLLLATNAKRTDNGEQGLVLNSQLAAAAQAKAEDMAKRNYWSHVTPDGIEPWKFVTDNGYAYLAAGENLAFGFDNSAATVTGWMNSPGHRANILNDAYQEVGFGIANASNYRAKGQETIVVAFYGKPKVAIDTASVGATVRAPVASQPTADINVTASAPFNVPSPATEDPRSISRLQLVSSSVPGWSITASTIIILLGAAYLVIRHLRYWHRILIKGEQYALKHPMADILIITIVVMGAVLTHSAGFIH